MCAGIFGFLGLDWIWVFWIIVLILGITVMLFISIWRIFFPASWFTSELVNANAYSLTVKGKEKIKRVTQSLLLLGQNAVPSLIKAYEFGNRDLLGGVLSRIEWAPKNTNEELIYYFVRKEWENLASMGEPAIPCLIEAVECYGVRDAVIKIGEPAIAPLYDAFFINYDIEICNAIVKALFGIGSAKATEALILIASSDKSNRYHVNWEYYVSLDIMERMRESNTLPKDERLVAHLIQMLYQTRSEATGLMSRILNLLQDVATDLQIQEAKVFLQQAKDKQKIEHEKFLEECAKRESEPSQDDGDWSGYGGDGARYGRS